MFGDLLRENRRKSELSSYDIARDMAWSPSMLMHYETNKINPPASHKIFQLSELIKTDFQELFKSAFSQTKKTKLELPEENQIEYLNVAAAFINLWEKRDIEKLKELICK